MDLERLQTFLKVAQYGSFKRVADEQYQSQRAISKQIKQLESELGVVLFERQANRISLTPQGKFFRSSAQDIVNNYTKSIDELKEFDQQSENILRVGYFSAFEQRLLKSALYQLKQDNPTLHLAIREESNEHLSQSVQNGNLDAALSIQYGQPITDLGNDVRSQVIYTEQMVMGVSMLNPLAQKKFLTPEDLSSDKPILYYSPESSTFLLESFLASVPFIDNFQKVQRVTSVEQMQLLVSLDQALAFYPSGLLNEDLLTADSHIKLLPVEQTRSQQYQIVVLFRKDNPNPMLKQFLTLISEN